MKFQYFLFSFYFFLVVGCAKDDIGNHSNIDCIQDIIQNADMVPYNGENIGCAFYLDLWLVDEQQYFSLGSHCADIAFQAVDCAGNVVCEITDDACKTFNQRAVNIGIIAYKKE